MPEVADGPLFCGVDVGASATKLLLLDARGETLATAVRRSGVDYRETADKCLEEALAAAGIPRNRPVRTVSTGYGRRNVDFADANRTELFCHGAGCFHSFPRALTIIDIGGQDNKVIHLDEHGRQVDFKMNRKCAAGTGAFLEEIAMRLDVQLDQLDALAAGSTVAAPLNSFCTVFAATEILSHLREGVPLADLIRGAFVSVVKRVAEMDPLDGEVILTGGVVAHNPTTAEILSARLGKAVEVPPLPQFTGALGAALTALEDQRETSEEEHA